MELVLNKLQCHQTKPKKLNLYIKHNCNRTLKIKNNNYYPTFTN